MIRDAFRRARAEASWQQWALLAVGLACAIAVRFSLGPLSTGDYTHFMKGWIEVLREQGFAAFGTSFANYNPPFLYLLYLFGLLPIGGLAVSGASLVVDVMRTEPCSAPLCQQLIIQII